MIEITAEAKGLCGYSLLWKGYPSSRYHYCTLMRTTCAHTTGKNQNYKKNVVTDRKKGITNIYIHDGKFRKWMTL